MHATLHMETHALSLLQPDVRGDMCNVNTSAAAMQGSRVSVRVDENPDSGDLCILCCREQASRFIFRNLNTILA